MSSLGDFFSDELREEFADRSIKVGTVLRAFVKDTTPPKIKRFIVVGITGDKVALGIVFINSEINPNLFPTEEFRQLHVPMTADERSLIDHDSFIDCSRIIERKMESIQDLIKNDISCLLGELNSQELQKVKSTLKATRTISISIKRKFNLF